MLAESVVAEFGGEVEFVSENYGASELARRFGVTRYPALFVGDVLVATPKDFGYFGKGEGPDVARYALFRSAASHELVRSDLRRVIELMLSDGSGRARAAVTWRNDAELSRLPQITLTDLDGRSIDSSSLRERVVLIEFWATWCPPCRKTLAWLDELQRRFGERLTIVTCAVDSEEAAVRAAAATSDARIRWTIATPELARAFGDISAFPTLYLFARDGSTDSLFVGAPPTLHAEAEQRIESLLR